MKRKNPFSPKKTETILNDDLIFELTNYIDRSDWNAFMLVSKQFHGCGFADGSGIRPTLWHLKRMVDRNATVVQISDVKETFVDRLGERLEFSPRIWSKFFVYAFTRKRLDIVQFILDNNLHEDELVCLSICGKMGPYHYREGRTPEQREGSFR